ncbi:MAG: hypothetical protein JAY97_00145 [Candidatus Thiodiazotropha sp. 'RUGA']|nr:hypothetical protein [Candidatus Thiodiazotropha sp. 'RUGA']
MSIRANSAEAIGMFFNPTSQAEWIVAAQLPQTARLDTILNALCDLVWQLNVDQVEYWKFVL